jgi:hypothetical protein
MHRQRAVVPGIVQLVAAVGHENQIDAELFRGRVEGAGLVAKFAGKKKNSGSRGHIYMMRDSQKKVSACGTAA